MVPSTETSVIAFVLLVIPGIVFELLWQRTRPRRDESAFVEISRVLLTGVMFTGLATLLVILLAVVPGTAVSVVDLVREGAEYLTRDPALAVSSAVTEVLLAICLAVVGHDLITPRGMRRIAQETVWQTAFGRMAAPGVRVFLSVQLKNGTTITGYSAGYSTETDTAKRDLLLSAPLKIRHAGQPSAAPLDEGWQSLVVSGAEISTIAAAYVGTAQPSPRPGRRRRVLIWLSRNHGPIAYTTVGTILITHLVIAFAIR